MVSLKKLVASLLLVGAATTMFAEPIVNYASYGRSRPDGTERASSLVAFNVEDVYELSAFGSSKKVNKIITTLDVNTMECKPVLEPRKIETALFNIHSGNDALTEDTKNPVEIYVISLPLIVGAEN